MFMFQSVRGQISALLTGATLLSGCGAKPTPEAAAIASDALSETRANVVAQARDVGGAIDLLQADFGGISDAQKTTEAQLMFANTKGFEGRLVRVKEGYRLLGEEIAQLDSAYTELKTEAVSAKK
jgi:hypothetical protein